MSRSVFGGAATSGIHTPHLKNTRDCETTELLRPKRVTLLMAQHIGAPAKPCVEKGQRVFVGTLVGEAQGFVSANIHASVSGEVSDITEVLTPTGARSQAVVIESDGLFERDGALKAPYVNGPQGLVEAARASGLVGLGGAGFPSHVKLSIPEGAEVDTLLINAAECEPYITSDYREMIESPKSIVNGVRTVREILELPRAIIAVEDNKPLAIEILTRFAAYKDIEVLPLKSSYPQGAEKVLITNATGRVVPAGKLPSDAGCLVMNVGSISFLSRYLESGMPLVNKRLTVDGDAVAKSCNMLVPIGTPVGDIIEAAGGWIADCERLLFGGPMMGTAIYDLETPVCKNNNALLALTKKQVSIPRENPCIRCGRCVEACPMSLSPVDIQLAYERGETEELGELGVMNCIECGSCTFVCPAKRSITQTMRLSKGELRKAAKKK
ncbi:MAG: electron transport complex subunit RsxC [Oscillospiraceae bacterium]|nr:electron transport complex subunit RsxC [Oscillospiraceae bacterium]